MADDSRSDDVGDDADDPGPLRFTLPPLSLPRVVPPDLPLVLPAPGRVRVAGRHVLAAAVAVDAADAALALLLTPAPVPVLRGLFVALIATVHAGRYGLLAGWEPVVAALGGGPVTALPTATALVLVRGWARDR